MIVTEYQMFQTSKPMWKKRYLNAIVNEDYITTISVKENQKFYYYKDDNVYFVFVEYLSLESEISQEIRQKIIEKNKDTEKIYKVLLPYPSKEEIFEHKLDIIIDLHAKEMKRNIMSDVRSGLIYLEDDTDEDSSFRFVKQIFHKNK